jgi:hypothetical protein
MLAYVGNRPALYFANFADLEEVRMASQFLDPRPDGRNVLATLYRNSKNKLLWRFRHHHDVRLGGLQLRLRKPSTRDFDKVELMEWNLDNLVLLMRNNP